MLLWDSTPGLCEETPQITYYKPTAPAGDGAVVIFPGGGYHHRAEHEGKGYAEFLAAAGVHAFVVDYRVAPHRYPLPQLDARRGVRFVRAHVAQYGIDPEKIAVMGSSAGGHLAAITATSTQPISFEGVDEVDSLSARPNAQILCYPVILPPTDPACHTGSYHNLLGGRDEKGEQVTNPVAHVTTDTPPAFIWHTAADPAVSVCNSYAYATALRQAGVPVEMHIFPYGHHGLGLAQGEPHVSQWSGLLLNWLRLMGWMK